LGQPGGSLTKLPDIQPAAADVLAALPVPVLLVDAENCIRNANTAAEALLNRSQAAMVGKPLSELLRIPDLANVPRREQGGMSAYDIEIALPSGNVRADLAEVPLTDEEGWRVISIHLLSAAHRVNHGAERSGATLAAVGAAAILAHEIKNPLSSIRGAAQLLAAGGSGIDDEGAALTRLITREVDRIAALIDGMQRFGDERPLPLQPANVFPMLEHARDLARAGFGSHVRIVEDYDPSLPPVLVHQDSFVQVMLNLLKNACEVLPDGGKVTISAQYRGGLAVSSGGQSRRALPIEIAVADNGPGAPPEIADHLFEPFVSGSKKGQGLGLTLVEKLVRDMGGVVRYSREGEQTIFRVRLARGAAK
jgi:two-component system, NtrC family, nitrogen regulation sensor histidine kinase GlnL